jgi:thiol:disulfide interchange protein
MMYPGLWMAGGVVAFWGAIGVPVVLFSTFADPSQIFARWWVTSGLGVLIVVMALGLMGLFNLQLPQGLYMLNPRADSAWGSFLFGIMTAVLGLPCFGFVAGALLAAAATLPKIATMATFLGLGVGMALPYLALAWKPGWIERIPRSGPASDLVKQVMGLLLFAAGAYFIGSGLIGLVAGKPYMGKVLHLWVVALFALLAGQWLLIRTFQISRSFVKRVTFTFVALALGVGAVTFAWDATQRAKYDRWVEFEPASFDAARSSGKVVVVDFTASWCTTCIALKAGVLSRNPAKSELYADDVVLMKVDYTGENPVGEKFQSTLGRGPGIPLLAVFPAGGGDPWLANSYTGTQVAEAIRSARDRGEVASLPR